MRAKTFAVNTRYAALVRPKIAGIESRAKTRSVVPSATITMSIGVTCQRPLRRGGKRGPVVVRRDGEPPLRPAEQPVLGEAAGPVARPDQPDGGVDEEEPEQV